MLREAIDLLKGVEDEKALGLIQRDIKDCVKLIVISNALSDESTNFTEDRDVHGEQRFLELSWLLSLIENKDDFICDTLIPELRKLNNFREIFILIPLLSSPPLREQALLQSLFGIRGLSGSFLSDQSVFWQIALSYSPLLSLKRGAFDFARAIEEVKTTIEDPLLSQRVVNFLLTVASLKQELDVEKNFSLDTGNQQEMFLTCTDICIRWGRQTEEINLSWLNLFDAYFLGEGFSHEELVNFRSNFVKAVDALVSGDFKKISESIRNLNLLLESTKSKVCKDFIHLMLMRLLIAGLDLAGAQEAFKKINTRSTKNFACFYLAAHYSSCEDLATVLAVVSEAKEVNYREALWAVLLKLTLEKFGVFRNFSFVEAFFNRITSRDLKFLVFITALHFAKESLNVEKDKRSLSMDAIHFAVKCTENLFKAISATVSHVPSWVTESFDDFVDYCIDLSPDCRSISGDRGAARLILCYLLPTFCDPTRCVKALIDLPSRLAKRNVKGFGVLLVLEDSYHGWSGDRWTKEGTKNLFDPNYLAEHIWPYVSSLTGELTNFIRYLLLSLDDKKWWTWEHNHCWRESKGPRNVFRLIYALSSFLPDKFDQLALQLEAVESESFYWLRSEEYFFSDTWSGRLFHELVKEIIDLSTPNYEKKPQKVKLLCRLARLRKIRNWGSAESLLGQGQQLYEELPETKKQSCFEVLQEAWKFVYGS